MLKNWEEFNRESKDNVFKEIEKSLNMNKIIKMTPFHCAKSARGCAKCKTLADEGAKYCLLSFFGGNGVEARPIMEIEMNRTKIWADYDIVEIFKSKEEAIEYAKQHYVEIEVS